MNSLTIGLDNIPDEKKSVVIALIAAILGYEFNEQEAPEVPSPSAAFGPAVSEINKVDVKAPFVEIPPPPAPALVIPPPPPPAANIPSANSQPAQPGATNAGTILDKAGLPWDGRIHASSKATNADGTWRLKRNVDKTLIDTVTAELQRAMAAPSAGPQLVPPPPPPAPTQAPPPPPPPADDVRKAYVDLVGRAASAQGAGKITLDQVLKCLSAVGVESMPALGHRLDLVPAAASLIDGIIAGAGA